MKKLGLLLAAGTMLASTGGAMATTTSITLNNFCDELTLTYGHQFVAMNEASTSCSADIMGGFLVKVAHNTTPWYFVGGPRFGSGTNAWGFLVQRPLATGDTWGLYESTDGVSYNLVASGTYNVGTARVHNTGLPAAGKGTENNIPNSKLPKTLNF